MNVIADERQQPSVTSTRLPVALVFVVWFGLLFVLPAVSRLTGGNNLVAGLLTAMPFAASLYFIVIAANRGAFSLPRWRPRMFLSFAWAALLLISVVRSNNDGHQGGAGLLLASLWLGILVSAMLLSAEIHGRDRKLLDAVLWSLSIAAGALATVNVVLHLSGVESSQALLVDHPEGSIAALLGVRLDRTLFPMARGINNFGVVAGMGVAGSLSVVLVRGQSLARRLVGALFLIGSLVALVFVDSRGPLLFGLISGIGVPLLFLLRRGRSLKYTALLAPVLPVLLLGTLSLVARSEIVKQLSRQKGDIASATGRALIWGAAAGRLAAQPRATDVVGYGQYGAKGAGISVVWASQFQGFEADPLLTSTHNLTLQLIYDVGYVGLALVLAALWHTLVFLAREHDDRGVTGAVPASAVVVFLLLAGTTEATISIIFPESLVFMSILLSLRAMAPQRTTA